MCIYCGTSQYRKIYNNHNGPIPIDHKGRTFDIHHLDGNRENNLPENLIAVSIEEHYNIHKLQGDWGACFKLAQKLSLSPKELSEIARLSAFRRVEKGEHPFLGKTINESRIKNGTHNLLGLTYKKLKDGTHNFLGDSNPSKIKFTCPHCNKTGGGKSAMFRFHFDNCKNK
jgi:hypothetical protein